MNKIKFNIPNSNNFSKMDFEKLKFSNNYIKGIYEKKCIGLIRKILDTKKKYYLQIVVHLHLKLCLCLKIQKI